MAGQGTMLDQIENGALDSRVPLADVLRKCLALAGQANSIELRDWARQELEGYPNKDALPDYRLVPAMIAVDAVTYNAVVTQQQISPRQLPEFTHGLIDEQAPVFWGVGQVQSHLERATDSVKLTLPGAAELTRVLNSESGHIGQQVTAIYWVVSPSVLAGVLDRVRTNLVGLVAELRASGGLAAGDMPTPEAASQAVQVIVNGAKRSPITVNTAQTGGHASSGDTVAPARSKRTGFDLLSKPGAFVVGFATIVGTVAAVAAWQDWNPF